MPEFPLTILAGRDAIKRIERDGWSPELFTALVGASGGAKLLGLTHLDRFLFGDYLQQTSHRMDLYGSSIGSWRHAALASPEPLAAITGLQDRYLNQQWDENDRRKPHEVVDELCDWVLDSICSTENASHICNHPRFNTHIVTARGLGLNNAQRSLRLGLGMGLAAIRNTLGREQLAKSFQRVVFSTGPSWAFEFSDFSTRHVSLSPATLKQALLASGSIPFLMSGQQDIPAAPPGQYWDGGIIDYHFDFSNHSGNGLVLYPHFSERVAMGWFDKSLPWRANSADQLSRTIILAPSRSYLSRLPNGRIPDRRDFSRMSQQTRMICWKQAMDMSRELADAFDGVVRGSDPLSRVRPTG